METINIENITDPVQLKLHGVMPEVAKELGWTWEPVYQHGGYLQSPTFRLFARVNHQTKRFEISVSLDRNMFKTHTVYDFMTYDERNGRVPAPTVEITVSADKCAEKIACDIQNRLVNDADTIYTRALIREMDRRAYEAKVNESKAKLAAILNLKPYGQSDQKLWGYSDNWRVEVDVCSTVDITLTRLSTETAAKILEVLKNV